MDKQIFEEKIYKKIEEIYDLLDKFNDNEFKSANIHIYQSEDDVNIEFDAYIREEKCVRQKLSAFEIWTAKEKIKEDLQQDVLLLGIKQVLLNPKKTPFDGMGASSLPKTVRKHMRIKQSN